MATKTFRAQEPQEEEVQQFGQARALPVNDSYAIYARQSTTKQVLEAKESTEMQTTDLIQKALKMGFKENLCILYVEGNGIRGVSGTLRIDQREHLSALVERIYTDEIKVVFVYSESRLFRDEFQIQVDTFIKACYDHDVRVITANYVYDFRHNPYAMQQFRMQCQIAADYIKNQVKGLLLPAKRRAAMRGQYVGGTVPMGYIVDYRKGSDTYRKYVPYKPHAEIVHWMFRRFRELDGKIHMLAREILRMPFLYPDFQRIDHVPYVGLRKVDGGYQTSLESLRYTLTNTAYIGYWTVAGTTVSKSNHEPIVSEDDFFYAFNRLSDTTPDGEEQERTATRPTRYNQIHTIPVPALLRDVLTCVEGSVFLQSTTSHYTVVKRTYGFQENPWSMKVTTLDSIFTQRLIYRLKQDMKEEEARDASIPPTPDNMLTRLQEVQATRIQQSGGIEQQLEQITRRLKRLDTLINLDEEDVDVSKLREYTREQKQLLQTQTELEKKLKQTKTSQDTIEKTQTLLERARNNWKGLSFQQQKEFVNLVVDKVVGEELSPHWFKLTIYWNAPYGMVDTGYIWRQDGGADIWTEKDKDTFRSLYPVSGWDALLDAFPRRSPMSLMSCGYRLGIKKEIRDTPTLALRMCKADLPVLEMLGVGYSDEWSKSGYVEWKTAQYNASIPLRRQT